MAINQDLRALILSSFASIDFYYIFFKTASYEGSGLTVKGIKVEELLNFPFPLPPLAEQHRIVAKVDELMKLCDELEATQAKREKRRDRLVASTLHGLNNGKTDGENGESLSFEDSARFYFNHLPRLTTRPEHIQQLRQIILNLAVRGKLVPQDSKDAPVSELLKRINEEKAKLQKAGEIKKGKSIEAIQIDKTPFDIPLNWRWVRLDELTTLITKGSSPKWQGVEYVPKDRGILFITSENVGNYRLRKIDDPKYVEKRFNEIEPRSILCFGDILMNLVGASIGRTAIFNLSVEANINQAVALIRIVSNQGLCTDFLLHYFNAPTAIQFMLASQVVTAQPNMSLTDAKKFPVPLPPLAEQYLIVAKVNELLALCDDMEERITNKTTTSRKLLETTLHEAIN